MKFSAATVTLLAGASVVAAGQSFSARSGTHGHLRQHKNIMRNLPSNATETAAELVARGAGGSGSATFYNTETGNAGSCGDMLSNSQVRSDDGAEKKHRTEH